jgi:D-alanine--poly(phosphoribitol) ligase subunit 1
MPRPTATVLSMIASRARESPESIAASDPDRCLSYQELLDEIVSAASALAERGVCLGDRVALDLPNSVDFVVAACATMWLGAVFVPVAPTDPAARVAKIIQDAAPGLVLIAKAADKPHRWQDDESRSGRLDRVSIADLVSEGKGSRPVAQRDGPIGYCIYTSGSSGRPKGVLIGTAAFSASISWAVRLLGIGPSTRSLCISPFHFDGSFGTLFSTPAAGGSLVIPRRESLFMPRVFVNTVLSAEITHTSFSPSYLRLLLSSPQIARLKESSLRTLALGGEACSANEVRRLLAAAPQLRVFNRYGPTETTIAVTTWDITDSALRGDRVLPIGRPHPGTSFVLIDSGDHPIGAAAATGELCIGGEQLMHGYLGDPDQTSSVLDNDLVPGTTLYRTGDIASRDSSGKYYYVGRASQVLKRNGVRISLAEISEALSSLPGISAAACCAYRDHGQVRVAGFVVSAADIDELKLRHEALSVLPASMLPDVLCRVEALPLTSSAKLDESALLRLLYAQAQAQTPTASDSDGWAIATE